MGGARGEGVFTEGKANDDGWIDCIGRRFRKGVEWIPYGHFVHSDGLLETY